MLRVVSTKRLVSLTYDLLVGTAQCASRYIKEEQLENLFWSDIQSFAVWGAIASSAAFFMQRLHFEKPDLSGAAFPVAIILSLTARFMIYVLYLCCLYVFYRINWVPALLCAAIFFLFPIIVTGVQLFFVRISTKALTVGSTPVGIVAFIFALLGLRSI